MRSVESREMTVVPSPGVGGRWVHQVDLGRWVEQGVCAPAGRWRGSPCALAGAIRATLDAVEQVPAGKPQGAPTTSTPREPTVAVPLRRGRPRGGRTCGPAGARPGR